ncbi:MAG: hypothetical protein HC887_06440 [Desulfobacteraceae bacterium]|nr:hypothetical protein [Desulfobacteraceae bacterium]
MDSKFITLLRKESGITGVKILQLSIVAGILQGLLMVINQRRCGTSARRRLEFQVLRHVCNLYHRIYLDKTLFLIPEMWIRF